MAGDWFPLQFWRSRCPEVVRVSSATGRTRHEVLGWVCDFWSWVSTESADGKVPGVYVRNLPEILGGDALLWASLVAVGWVAEDGAGIVVPGWDAWLCESAKKRVKDAKRKRGERSGGGGKGGRKASAKCPKSVREMSAKSVTTLQDITEEKKEEEKTPLPPAKPGGGTDPPAPESLLAPTPDFVTGTESAVIAFEPLAELVAAWVAAGLPGSAAKTEIAETPNRRAFWQLRQADDAWRAKWRRAVAHAGRSRACRGEDDKFMTHGLRLDTFLRVEDMAQRILEGEFDAARRPPARGDPKTDYATRTALDAAGFD